MCVHRWLLLILLSSSLCFATGRPIEDRLLDAGDNLAVKVDKAAEALDITLAGKKYIKKPNPSSININQLVTWGEGGVIRKSTDFGFNLRLPNVERRFQLRFS